MKYIFVVNPMAGKGKNAEEVLGKIKEACDSKEVDYEIYRTKSAGDATEYVKKKAAEHSGEELAFFACGGDGTLCEVANGIMACESRERLYLGTVPSGTGNDFVRNFSAPQSFSDISAQLDYSSMEIDLIACNQMYAVNMINIGFDCQVVCQKEELQKSKLFPSKLAYVAGLLITLIKKPGIDCELSLDGGVAQRVKLLLTTIGNGEYCGGGFHSNPESRINNGKLNVLTVNEITRRKFVSIVGSYKKGTHLVHTDILTSSLVEKAKYIFKGETNISVDGEVKKVPYLELSCVKNAVKFLLPRGCEYLMKKVDSADALCVN